MTKDELKNEAEVCMHNALFWLKLPISKENVEQGGSYILKLLEPREKRIAELEKENTVLEKRIERAKKCMKKLLFIINSDPANYNCKGLVQDAEDFIYNRTCNIRQQGEHCITEERCIMCDMEIKEND